MTPNPQISLPAPEFPAPGTGRCHTAGPARGGEAAAGSAPALTITVYGKPAPQGSKRATLHNKTGRIVTMESSKRVKPWREAVKEAALRSIEAECVNRFGGAYPSAFLRLERGVRLDIVFCFDKPKSAPKRRRTWPITRSSGDVDKLQRSTFDALADAGVFKDDSQVIDVRARKVFTDDPDAPLTVPGAVIRVFEIGGA